MENTGGGEKGQLLPWHRRRGWLHPFPRTPPAPGRLVSAATQGREAAQGSRWQRTGPACPLWGGPEPGVPAERCGKLDWGAVHPAAGRRPQTQWGTWGRLGWCWGDCSSGRRLAASTSCNAVGSPLPVTQLKKSLKLSLKSRCEV